VIALADGVQKALGFDMSGAQFRIQAKMRQDGAHVPLEILPTTPSSDHAKFHSGELSELLLAFEGKLA